MAFITIQQEDFLNDVMKTWIRLLKDTFPTLNIKVDRTDSDNELELPLIAIKKVSSDKWSLRRNGGYFGERNNTVDMVKTLVGYTYTSLLQFDILTTTITESNTIQGKLNKLLLPDMNFQKSLIKVKHFPLNNNTGEDTDLLITFNFEDDVDGATLSTFDENLHQHSISVKFNINYLSEKEDYKVIGIGNTIDII